MKKLLILGGSDLQVSIIKQAKSLGHYVITCDYLPSNPGHQYADEYYNVSTTDRTGIYELAKVLKPDGILAYASDPAAPVAAWVCEKLELPTNPYNSVKLLSRKDLFRSFMERNKFNVPKSKSFKNYERSFKFFDSLNTDAIIKPVDSSGSKGVYKLIKGQSFKGKFEKSFSFSKIGLIIIEEFLEKKGFQIGGDGFLVNGNLVFRCFGDIHFSNTNPLLPCSLTMPTMHPYSIVLKVHNALQRLLTAIDMKMGGLNFDVLIDKNDEVFVLEIGPRNGGNLIPELTQYCTGVDMKKYAIKTALGEECNELKMSIEKKYFSHYVVHSKETGVINKVEKSDILNQKLIYEHYNFSIGNKVESFQNSSNRLGILILNFNEKQEMLDLIYNMDNHLKLILDET